MACFASAASAGAPTEESFTNEPIASLETVTVYATRSPQETFDVPAMVSKVDASAAGNALAGDINQLLQFTPGVDVEGSPRRVGQVVSIRGFDEKAIITLIDGRRQNFDSSHDGNFFIDPNLLKSVEVVKGASSAIYGGGGIGGVLAFETKDAADLLEPGETTGAMTSMAYRSANEEFAPSATAFALHGNWDLLANVSYRNSNDIEQGDGKELQAEDRMISGLFKAGYGFNDFHTIKFQMQLLNNDGKEPNNGAQPIATSDNPVVDKQTKDKQFGIKYAFEDPSNDWVNLKAHLYYNTTEVEETDLSGLPMRGFPDGPPCDNAIVKASELRCKGRVQTRQMRTTGFTLDNQSALSPIHTLSYGFEIYEDEQKGTNNQTPIRGGAPTAEARTYGFYLQDEIEIQSDIGEFLIIPAARFDKYKSKDKQSHSQNESKVSPKFAASYKPNETWMFFGSWARAFRAPSLTEIYAMGQHFPSVSIPCRGQPGCPPSGVREIVPRNMFIPNPKLKPETVDTIELGAGLRFENVLTSEDKAILKASWWTADGDDFISQKIDIPKGQTTFLNIPDAEIDGWEAEGKYQTERVTLNLGFSYVEAKNKSNGEWLDNNVPMTLIAGIEYELGQIFGYESIENTIGWRSRFARANNRVSGANPATSGYGVNDVYYRLYSNNESGELTVDLGIDNVFDKAYTKRIAFLLEEGRSFNAKAGYKW